jgi:S1-C subfamily serine protease
MKRVVGLCAVLVFAAAGAKAQTLTLTQLAQKVKPSIAKVISTIPDGQSIGTAFMIQNVQTAGRMLTNCHVVKGASKVEAQFVNYGTPGVISPPPPMEAKVLGCDEFSDLAVIEISSSGFTFADIPPALPFANPHKIAVGQAVATVGFAMNIGGDPSIEDGTINGLDRTLEGKFGGLIQTNATINHGNSGGPLMNMQGEVVGVNTYTSPANGPHNIFYARSVETAMPFAEQIIRYGGVVRADFGLGDVKNVSMDTHTTIFASGVKILSFTPGSPLEKAGAKVGDTIVSILPCPNYEKFPYEKYHDYSLGCLPGIESKKIIDIGTLTNVLGIDVRPKMYALIQVARDISGTIVGFEDQPQFLVRAN